MSGPNSYVGKELELFAEARTWKAYFHRQLRPFIRGDVLEVGAGLGGTTAVLREGNEASWTCLEPDPSLAKLLETNLSPAGQLPTALRIVVGTTATLPADEAFDTLLYVDVLEHIENDGEELARAARLLRPGGHLCTLSPAHPWLFTPFDQAIGHFRRYSRRALRRLTPPGTKLVRLRYVDSAGMLASLGNRLFLKASLPTPAQIAFWDRCLVPLSRGLDRLTAYCVGKSIVAVWRKL
jgi:SAM-dependent methyltransferase